MRIGRTFRFEAAHYLPKAPRGHKCRHLHGHSYVVEVVVVGTLDEHGWVLDYADLKRCVQPHIDKLDHCELNKHIINPTAENVALRLFKWIHDAVPGLELVRVSETRGTWAEADRWDDWRS